jgi:hypothetical protein
MNSQNPRSSGLAQFEEAYVRLVWSELHTRFGFPVHDWKKRFLNYCQQSRINDPVEGFYKFGNEVINPVLNEILCRKTGHPTFQKLVEYVAKKGWK